MEQSAPCTPETGQMSVREADMMSDGRGGRTPASCGVGPSFMSDAQSPLGQLDPHRLRDMVVDKQNPCCQPQVESPYKQQYWDPSHPGAPIPSPSNMRGPPPRSNSPMTPMMHPQRMQQGPSAQLQMRDSSILSPGGVRTPMQQMGMCIPGRSPLGSPGAMHPPQSPFLARPPSNASPSAYMQPPQTPVHYPQGMQQMPQNPNAGVMNAVQVPPASPSGYPPRMGPMGPPQQQYPYHPQVQQQWSAQPQTHYVGQPQMMGASGPAHRVMVQRVPYPGYPQGMAQPQSSSGQPPPQAMVYPQGGPPPQPQRAMYAAAPQQMTAAPQPNMPPAHYPPAYYQQKGQPAYAPQPQMYRQQPAQSVPVRPYLGSQPPQMSSSPVYPMYPAPNPLPQPNVHPQQYSPVGRYPAPVQSAPGISPCYPPAGHDMRSPQLISPTQAPVVPTGVQQAPPPSMVPPVANTAPPMQRTMSGMDLQGAAAPMPPQHVRLVPQSPFYGHEPSVVATLQPDMCLVGCFFIVVEHDKYLVDNLDLRELGAVVRMHGGEIEFGLRAYNNSERVTHVICESMRHSVVQQALKDRKRCVTLQWLNDVLAKKRMEVPWRVSHLPVFWVDGHRPAAGKIIAMSGFNESESSGVRMMIIAIGARFTPYVTKQNHFLVAKSCEGEKVERCREMGVAIVNYAWLAELYLGVKNAVRDNENGYFPGSGPASMFSEVNVSPFSLEQVDVCKQFLAAWKQPVIFTSDQWQRATDVKRSVENDENIFPNKKIRMSTPPPSEEQIEQRRSQIGPMDQAPIICFSGFTPEEMDILGKKVRFLGGSVTNCVSECTHLVVLNLWRTIKLLQAIALGKYIVGPNWITDGFRCRIIPDTLDYFIRDEENEKVFGYNLKYSVLRAQYRKVFEDVTFYLTPSVEPSYGILSSLIALAGGRVLKEKPQPHFVIQCIETDAPLLLISNESDVHLLQYLTDCGMPVFNAEIVLTGILRQKLENSPLYRVTPSRPPLHQTPSPNPPASKNQQVASQRVAA